MLNIIYEDAHIIVCGKPAGLAVQNASFGKKDLESMVRTYLAEKEQKANPYLAVIHRLDQPVQGIVIFAKNKKTAAALSSQVQDGRMQKQYLAVVCGQPDKKQGELVDFLLKNKKGNVSEKVPEGTAGAKKAVLEYQVLKEQDGLALVKIKLCTGRHHQIRVQMAAAGMPLFGDVKYNPAAEKNQGLALCADQLTIVHPVSGKTQEFFYKPCGNGFEKFT